MEFIDQFESHYNYDCNYMRKLAKDAPEAFKAFVDFLPMGQVGKSLPTDILWTAKIAAMLTEDCGACVQLNITMALEAGVNKNLVKNIIKAPENLEDRYKQIYQFAKAVAANQDGHLELQKEISKNYTAEQVAELSIAISSTRIYPTIKRALGEFKSCQLFDFSFS
ncbi:hypothetical protein [Bacteriovorax sp. Seq25_V]|uniref:hypothetical protein n=1 Tax=Bacteriovorax sp. Seq25_V TaxID=1201288 RepID=UPI000389FD37|nr:hypothetical protein [Bacteriovorax sp. Seq25_V]EQC45555.1 hypothetical protein M900_2212 [Bacteriovorax sp. Seq25_V]